MPLEPRVETAASPQTNFGEQRQQTSIEPRAAGDIDNRVPGAELCGPSSGASNSSAATCSNFGGGLNIANGGLNPDSSVSDQSSHIIPGVEHVFFEEELEKMEQQVEGNEEIIVLGADGSGPSDLAFKFYVENVNRPGYVLHIVHHSNYWGNYEPMDGGPSPKHCQELMTKENAKIEEIKEKYAQLMAQHNVKGEFITLTGKDAWHDIIQHQEKVKAIMIVMGTRGQSTMRRTFLGSVSDDVVHHATCPVLVCCHPKH